MTAGSGSCGFHSRAYRQRWEKCTACDSVYTSCPARSHICTSIAGTAGEGDVIAPKELAELGIANGAPKPLDGEIKEELDPLAPEGVAGNVEPNAAAEAEEDVTAARGFTDFPCANGAPKPLDGAIKEELDPLAPEGVAGNVEPNAAAEAEEDVTAAKGLTDFGCANGADGFTVPKPPNGAPPPHNPGAAAPKPLDGEMKEELDPIAPNGVAGNENPNERNPLLAAAEFPKPAEAAPKPMLARLEESAGAEALCPP